MAPIRDEIRLRCLKLGFAMKNNARGDPIERASALSDWVGEDSIRLGCAELAVANLGMSPRAGADLIVAEAEKYLKFVAPEPVEAPKPKRSIKKKT